MRLRALIWGGACALVVLASRSLAYQLAPRPTLVGSTLEQAMGGPGLVVTATVAPLAALAFGAIVVWLATVGVRERHLLAGGRAPAPIRPVRVLASAAGLFVASCLVFDALESYLHWRAGLGYHGLHCLLGPVHRDALPILGALSLVAAALVAAARHVIAWMRRALEALAQGRPLLRPLPLLVPAEAARLPRRRAWGRVRTRGPPSLAGVR